MNRLPLLLVSLLAVPTLASAAPVPAKTMPPPVRPDLLASVRFHVAALSRQPIAVPGVAVRGPLTVPPAFASPRPAPPVTVMQGPVADHR